VNGIARIHVQGLTTSGGGNDLTGWARVSDLGVSLQTVSSGTNLSLYEAINWTADLTSILKGGDYFALVGGESSAAVSRTFTFYDAFDQQISQLVLDLEDTGLAVLSFAYSTDDWIRFYYNGSQVEWSQLYRPIARIRVTGTYEPSGGGNPLSGYYRVSDVGANLGQLSPGHSQTLYQTTSWEVALTTAVQSGQYFALVGNEGSAAISRTFTFLDADSRTIDSELISNLQSDAIVRTSTFNSSDAYIRFSYDNGRVASSESISQ
jgi:hypothetical protein